MMSLAEALGPIGVWGHLDSLPAADARAYAARTAELGYGCLWVPETAGREPFALLGALAQSAGPMWLGTSIVSIWGHDAMTTRMAAQTLQELTVGRFVLGLGVSHLHLAQKLRGHTYDQPLTRMREFLDTYRRLPYRGPTLPDAPAGGPPVVIAALRARMLGLAATQTDGAFPYLVDAPRVRWIRATLDETTPVGSARRLLAVTLPVVLEPDAEHARAAARSYLAPYLRTPNYQASWTEQGFEPADWAQPGSDRLVDAMIAWGTRDDLRAGISAMHAAGADHVALIPVAPDGTTEHLPTLEALRP